MNAIQTLRQVWPTDPNTKVFLCGESKGAESTWPYKGMPDTEEGQDILQRYGDCVINTNLPCGSMCQYIYVNLDMQMEMPEAGEQITMDDLTK